MRVGYEGRGGGLEYRTCVITRGRSSFCDRSEAHFHMYNESFRWLAIFKLFTLGLSYDEVVEHNPPHNVQSLSDNVKTNLSPM